MKALIEKIRVRDIQLLPVEKFRKNISHQQQLDWFFGKNEHYMLLSWMANNFNDQTLYDIGTFRGLSALALACNENNRVVSYDIENFVNVIPHNNISFVIGDFFTDPYIIKSPLIVFDVDPHDGIIETKFFEWLSENDYKGIVVVDDIHLNDAMKAVWKAIAYEKHDLTEFGHWSGTGVVIFE